MAHSTFHRRVSTNNSIVIELEGWSNPAGRSTPELPLGSGCWRHLLRGSRSANEPISRPKYHHPYLGMSAYTASHWLACLIARLHGRGAAHTHTFFHTLHQSSNHSRLDFRTGNILRNISAFWPAVNEPGSKPTRFLQKTSDSASTSQLPLV